MRYEMRREVMNNASGTVMRERRKIEGLQRPKEKKRRDGGNKQGRVKQRQR